MNVEFFIASANKCRKQDLEKAIAIYNSCVDYGLLTDTNQIKDYIFNPENHKNEKRKMFFYLFYENNTVKVFAELAYLCDNQILVLDYLACEKRNNMLFYTFYCMAIQETKTELEKNGQSIRYIITELSLKTENKKLVDKDSNYFRYMLTNENFRLLKYPYYQPPLSKGESASEFNLAIKLTTVDEHEDFHIPKDQYLKIVEELYYSHYLEWFKNFVGKNEYNEYERTLTNLIAKIKSEIPTDIECTDIEMIQCSLFSDGQCPMFTPENETIQTKKNKRHKMLITLSAWIMFAIITFCSTIILQLSEVVTQLCSFITIVSGILTIITFRRDFLGRK